MSHCNELSLGGYGPGSWRLPTIGELRSLLRGCPETVTGGVCGVTDACLAVTGCMSDSCWTTCDYAAGPGARGAYWPPGVTGDLEFYDMHFYWSSSLASGYGEHAAWAVAFDSAEIGFLATDPAGFAAYQYKRCVRPGP